MRTDLHRGAARAGFTAIELLVVLVVILILIGMAVPALVGAMRKGSVNDAANAIIRVSSQARQFARTRMVDAAGRYYGLIIVSPNDGKGCYAALTYSATPPASLTESDIALSPPPWVSAGGKPISKLRFNRNVVVYATSKAVTDPSPDALAAGSACGWVYQFRTGYPIYPSGSSSGPTSTWPTTPSVNIGVDPNDPATGTLRPGVDSTTVNAVFPAALRQLSLRTADNKYRTAVAIYQIGLSNVQDF